MFCLIHESFGEIFATVITIEFKVFFMNNFYVHFQIVQIFCHIDHNWISFFMNSCNMFLQSNILYEIFAHTSQFTISWHLAQTKKIFIAKTIKFQSYLKICRGVMKENSSKNFFDPAENRNFDFPNRSLCSKTFTNCILTQILPFLLNFCTFTVIVLSSAVMAKCIKWF